MTSNQSTYAAILAMDEKPASRIDRVRARMEASRMSRNLRRERTLQPVLQATNSRLHLVTDTRRKTHPGDVLYWVACLGGACLLLLTATT
jgi:hypothetical protein